MQKLSVAGIFFSDKKKHGWLIFGSVSKKYASYNYKRKVRYNAIKTYLAKRRVIISLISGHLEKLGK